MLYKMLWVLEKKRASLFIISKEKDMLGQRTDVKQHQEIDDVALTLVS